MNKPRKILVTGVTGQDGSWMAEYLLNNTDNFVYGSIRRTSMRNLDNVEKCLENPRFKLIDLDISDPVNVSGAVKRIEPDYIINFAANSFVGNSWDMPANHFQNNTMSVLYFLDAVKTHNPTCRFYNAGSSEEWGNVDFEPQDETHPLKPRSPYGASKASARHITKVYRESYGIYAVQGWLFNHEGTRRGPEFVTRKISLAAAKIRKALDAGEPIPVLELGNLEAKRDWGDAEDYVDAVWRMMNQDIFNEEIRKGVAKEGGTLLPDKDWVNTKYLSKHIKDYVVSSDECHSIREFVEVAFEVIGIKTTWVSGKKPQEELLTQLGSGKILMRINLDFYRPAEVDILRGCSKAIREELGWKPKGDFRRLVYKMVEHDLKNV